MEDAWRRHSAPYVTNASMCTSSVSFAACCSCNGVRTDERRPMVVPDAGDPKRSDTRRRPAFKSSVTASAPSATPLEPAPPAPLAPLPSLPSLSSPVWAAPSAAVVAPLKWPWDWWCAPPGAVTPSTAPSPSPPPPEAARNDKSSTGGTSSPSDASRCRPAPMPPAVLVKVDPDLMPPSSPDVVCVLASRLRLAARARASLEVSV